MRGRQKELIALFSTHQCATSTNSWLEIQVLMLNPLADFELEVRRICAGN
jgi:hypothetical protein